MSNETAVVASAYLEVSPDNDAIIITNLKAVLDAIAEISMEGRGRLFTDALEIMEQNSIQRLEEAEEAAGDDETNVITLNLNNPFVRSMFESMRGPSATEADCAEVVK